MPKRKKKRRRTWWKGGLKRLHCSGCDTARLHKLATRVDDSGYFVRVWICTVPTCCLSTPAGSFVCRLCGHPSFFYRSVGATRYSRPGAILRMKVCRKCGAAHRTVERIECVVECRDVVRATKT